MKKILRKIFKTIAWCLFSIVLLLILLLMLIQVPAVQCFIKTKVEAYLGKTIHTKVAIGKLAIDFPSKLSLGKIYLEDQHKDTLFACDSLVVNIAMLKLISSNVAVNSVYIKGLVGNVHRIAPDTSFNFDYIIKAFSSADTNNTKAKTASSWKISLGSIALSNIRVKYADDVLGYDLNFKLDDLHTITKTFDPFEANYDISQIEINGIAADVKQYTPKTILHNLSTADTTEPQPIDLALKKIGLHNIHLDFNNEISKMYAGINLDTLGVLVDKIDLDKTAVKIQKVELNNSDVAVAFDKIQHAAKIADVSRDSSANTVNKAQEWKVELASVVLNNNSLKYDDNNFVKTKYGFDAHHIFINPFNLDASELLMSNETYAANLRRFSLHEQSGFVVKSLQTAFRYNGKEAFLKDFLLQTNNSKISSSVHATYSSMEDFTKDPGKVFAETSIDTCLIAVNDLLLLLPGLPSNFTAYKGSIIRFKGKARGFLDNINIPGASVSGIGNTSLLVNGNIKGLPRTESAFYNINIAKLVTTKKDVLAFIPSSTIPTSVRIPETISASGYFKGTVSVFNAKLDLNTSNGAATIISTLNTKTEQFDVNATLDGLDLGYILSQDSILGKISMTSTASGRGYDYKKMSGLINANITSVWVNNYDYNNLMLNASIERGQASFISSIDDENIRLSLSGDADVSKAYPAIRVTLQLDTANLNALHLLADTLGLKTNLTADFSSSNPDSLVGHLMIDHLSLSTDGKTFRDDTITLTAANEESIQSLQLNSRFLNVDWTGKYKLTEVAPALTHTLNHYFKIDGFKDSLFTSQQWLMKLSLNPSSQALLAFIPELKGSDSVIVALSYASDSDFISAAVNAPSIHYAGQAIDSLHLNASTSNGQFNYSLGAANAGTETLHLFQPEVHGYLKDDKLVADIALADENGADLYHIAGELSKIPYGVRFSLNNDRLLLNRNKWNLSEDNYAEYDSSGLLVHNFFLSKGEESLLVNSTLPAKNAPLETTFKNFHLKTLSEFTGNDSLDIEGLVNGFVTISNLKQNPLFTSDVKIENIQYRGDTIGTILAQISSPDEKTLQNNISLVADDKSIILTGKYFVGEQKFEQDLNIEKLGLHSFVGFSKGQLKTAGGSLNGKLAVTGKSDDLLYNGEFHFDSAYIVPSFLGEQFTLANETVNLDNKGIHFNKFTMTDSAGNKAVLDGSVLSSEGRNLQFQLDLNADDFRLVNSTKADNPDLYGNLNIDAAIKIRGDIQTPDINANLRVNKQTDLILVLPDVNPEVQDREGVVNFVDPQHLVDSSLIVVADTLPKFQMLAGLKLATNIQTDTSAAFTVVIDERNGDALKVKGSADLAASVDESGKVSLTGSYEVGQGSYQLTLSVLKRKFDIQKGSTITWTGDPTQANINITATYFLKAPTIELMQSELTGKTEEEKNKYKERLPITVLLKMKGELLKPDITFDITIPEDLQTKWDDVETKLKQLRTIETEMSKQVFALLLLSRFVEEDPMASSAGGTTEGLVRESVSRILSDQLNNLAGSLVKGVDLNVELTSTEDYSTGAKKNQTDLNVGVSKTMLNDRLRVNVGSNFMLEGANANQSTSTIAGDIAVDYALSADGRYRIRAYRKDEYEGTVEGQVVESGLTFIITMNYDKFKELFRKNKNGEKKGKK